ncbi:MAG: DMT family transporter, partial [Thermomonas sp.]
MTARGLHGRDLVLVLLVCLFWATNFLTSAHALREVPPFLFTAMRMGLLAAMLLPFLRLPPASQRARLFAVAMLNGVLHFGTSFLALKLAGNLSSPAIVTQVYVPMAVLLAWWVLGERFGWRTGVGVAVSFAGVLVLGFDPMVLQQPAALFVMMGSSLMVAIGTVLMRGLKDVRMVDQQGWTAVLSLLPLLAISAMFEPGSFTALREASWIGWGAAAYAAVFSSL